MAPPTITLAVFGEGKVSAASLRELLTDKIKGSGETGRPLIYLPLTDLNEGLATPAVLEVAALAPGKHWSYIAVIDPEEELPDELSVAVEGATKALPTKNGDMVGTILDAVARSSAPNKAVLLAWSDDDPVCHDVLERASALEIEVLDLTSGLAPLAFDEEDEEEQDDQEDEEEEDESDKELELDDDEDLDEEDDFEDDEDEDGDGSEEQLAPPVPANPRPAPAKPTQATAAAPPANLAAQLDKMVEARDKEGLYALAIPLGIKPARGLRLNRVAELILEAHAAGGVLPADAEKARPQRSRQTEPKTEEPKKASAPIVAAASAPAASLGDNSTHQAAIKLIQAALILLGVTE